MFRTEATALAHWLLTTVANVLQLKIIAIYKTEDEKRPLKQWIDSLRDTVTVTRINARLSRVEIGNFGNGFMELRLVFGIGFRINYGLDGEKLVVLLTGGDKSTQNEDTETAHSYWSDYLRRTHNG